MRVPSISNDLAIRVWNTHAAGSIPDLSGEHYDYIGDGDDEALTELELSDLVDDLEQIKIDYEGKVSKSTAGAIDSAIVEPVHSALRDIATPFQLSQLGFWRWLSNIASEGAFWRFIMWRLNTNHQINWGITSPAQIIEVYFYRAWLRGHKMLDESLPDPYAYAKKGSSDFWRSHVLRQDFGRDREFVKAFLDTVYDENGVTLVGTTELRTKLIPALRAWTSSATFTHLSYKECLDLISELREERI